MVTDRPNKPGSDDRPSDPLADLRSGWRQHIDADETPLDGVLRRHRERHRRYHTVEHVVAVVRHVVALADVEPVDDLGAVLAAAWYHDAVYEPRSSANERASARLARRDLASMGWQSDRADHVATMIEGTQHHWNPPNVDSAVLYDADLSILAVTSAEYAAYVHAVRSEYSHVAETAWRSGRATVLEEFLEHSRIYATDSGYQQWEANARKNLTAEIESLRS